MLSRMKTVVSDVTADSVWTVVMASVLCVLCSNASPSQSTARPVAAASVRLRGTQEKPASLSQQIPPPPEPIGPRPPEPLTPSAV